MGEKDHSDRRLTGDSALTYATLEAIDRARGATSDPLERAALLADVCRLNTLYMIMQAGSGHIGTSFSSMDLITWLWTEELVKPNSGEPGADTYFFERTRCAGAMPLLIALGKLDFDLLHRLRRLGGLPAPGRRHAYCSQHRLARHGDLEGVHAAGRRQSGRPDAWSDDGRRRAAGRADLGIAAAVVSERLATSSPSSITTSTNRMRR
jgi:hypothetical protein